MRFLLLPFSLGVVVTGTLLGCASTTPGSRPHDMSASQHEAMAAGEEKAAQVHTTQYNPHESVTKEHCPSGDARGVADAGGCWTSVTNPTSGHLDEARKHEKMAADHRAGSQALRDAEGRACVGISDTDRDMSPFEHREDITSVEPLTTGTTSGRSLARTEGAIVTFRAVPGMTAQWLQRVVDCHLARNAALGHDVPEMGPGPLVPKGATARVTGTDVGFAVAIRSDDSQTAQEILRRARSLMGR